MWSFGAILLPLRFNKIIGGATRVVEIEKLEKLEKLEKVESLKI
jgi:hypothetical protein